MESIADEYRKENVASEESDNDDEEDDNDSDDEKNRGKTSTGTLAL